MFRQPTHKEYGPFGPDFLAFWRIDLPDLDWYPFFYACQQQARDLSHDQFDFTNRRKSLDFMPCFRGIWAAYSASYHSGTTGVVHRRGHNSTEIDSVSQFSCDQTYGF